ncbi:N-acetylglucosamine kinase [Streptomyces albipurpureus]|uniref:ATPase n=1 Tax=Streptomyces albipurpureus TaxID=2897419 RepID=A0ABT0UYG8_9ACTN|nr:BadF/BadG/BcrA/BcrD ATPase family protein [Streptomyces sp. CWNU-1]MCM2392348.1 ATPase [Streptomyces sp. CWNU-1]
MTARWVLGVDSGGSGMRVALVDAAAPPDADAPPALVSTNPVRTGSDGIDAAHLLEQLLPMARSLLSTVGGESLAAVAIGAAGMATIGGHLRAELPAALRGALKVRRLALASDAVTAYAGALGQRPGVVVAAGTGLVALGTDLTNWRRADGWGHLLGDSGGGAWIGRTGLEAALRAYDGRRGGSTALLVAAESLFGAVEGLPAAIYPRADRPAVLASFAPHVARCAAEGDEVSAGILALAARHIADAAGTAYPAGATGRESDGYEVALTGGLLKLGDPLCVPLRAELSGQLPRVRQVSATGDPLAGSVLLASALSTDSLRLPQHSTLFQVSVLEEN